MAIAARDEATSTQMRLFASSSPRNHCVRGSDLSRMHWAETSAPSGEHLPELDNRKACDHPSAAAAIQSALLQRVHHLGPALIAIVKVSHCRVREGLPLRQRLDDGVPEHVPAEPPHGQSDGAVADQDRLLAVLGCGLLEHLVLLYKAPPEHPLGQVLAKLRLDIPVIHLVVVVLRDRHLDPHVRPRPLGEFVHSLLHLRRVVGVEESVKLVDDGAPRPLATELHDARRDVKVLARGDEHRHIAEVRRWVLERQLAAGPRGVPALPHGLTALQRRMPLKCGHGTSFAAIRDALVVGREVLVIEAGRLGCLSGSGHDASDSGGRQK
eukprot:CAMPEP_0176085470 /NCGR_PEP_ID=MMETSP0120_2-20121206/42776_1 /TAXON_ID=160619 /ORGANISM="Kryptoperidinium foliaceum, Strain CCMP 1326" /LENGTH=324 /DNA_ID=CAMNT_0017419285 /DNA_START=173 /DNA_END=1144 /DNA_ORIENTATION=+